MMDDDRAALAGELHRIIEAASAGGDIRHRVSRLTVDVCATLRRFGQEALATQYTEAFDRWLLAIDTLAICNVEGGDIDAAVKANDAAAWRFFSLVAEIIRIASAADPQKSGF